MKDFKEVMENKKLKSFKHQQILHYSPLNTHHYFVSLYPRHLDDGLKDN